MLSFAATSQVNCRARWFCFRHFCTDDTAPSPSSSSSSSSSLSTLLSSSLHCVHCTHVLQASSAALSPKFLKGIKAHMQVRRTPSRIVSSIPHTPCPPLQWPRVLTLCILFATVDSTGTYRALASTAHPLLVDASSRRQWSNTQSLPPAGLVWLDGNVQVRAGCRLPVCVPTPE